MLVENFSDICEHDLPCLFGGQLALFIWFFKLKYSFGHIINSKIFAQEFISIILGGIAVAISIPITAWITAFLIKDHLDSAKMMSLSINRN